jgi:hypothetical protein
MAPSCYVAVDNTALVLSVSRKRLGLSIESNLLSKKKS